MSSKPEKVSIIIPVLNELNNLRHLLNHLLRISDSNSEIIVADGGSTDGSLAYVAQFGSVKLVQCKVASRAHQLNSGAKAASGSIYYFLHADAWPPKSFLTSIRQAVNNNYPLGCFQMFLTGKRSKLIRINSYFSASKNIFSGGGDQSLYIAAELFNHYKGFDEQWVIMEDFEFIRRLKPAYTLNYIDRKILVSSRKYYQNSYLRVNLANLVAFLLFSLGCRPALIKIFYTKALHTSLRNDINNAGSAIPSA